MARLRVNGFSVSLDGYGAGPRQSMKEPLGEGGMSLHEWMFRTRTFCAMIGKEGGETGVDDEFAARGFENVGAWILGRNMFGPPPRNGATERGAWGDDSWKGWWGEEPPYHAPVFVLTHHPRAPSVMRGGTTFHFVTGGAEEARERALAAAGGKDVRVGGGAATVRQYLAARQIDEMHVAVSPRAVLGSGEHLWSGLDLKLLGYEVVERVATEQAEHVVLRRKG